MSIVLLKDLPEEDYLRIKKLYIDSFPVDERMEFEDLYGESPLGERKLLGIYHEGELAGFMALYNFEDWIYLLYFAIDPSLRGKGIGGQALAELNEMRGDKTITLDIERVPEGISDNRLRRRDFYLKRGYRSSGYFSHLFGVDYEYLILGPAREPKDYLALCNSLWGEDSDKVYLDGNTLRIRGQTD